MSVQKCLYYISAPHIYERILWIPLCTDSLPSGILHLHCFREHIYQQAA